MTLLLLSKSHYIQKELEKQSKLFEQLSVYSDIEQFKTALNDLILKQQNIVVLHHINDFNNAHEFLLTCRASYGKLHLIALSNTPKEIEGCKFLQQGYQSYLHALSNEQIMQSAINSVKSGNIYVYPKLMQFLVSNIPQAVQHNPKLELLSNKELEVLQLVAKGYSNANIAKELDIAEVTVKKHIGAMFEKLEVKDRLSLALLLK
jgi:DNA-binding NarL/FixJ family response regulator